MLLIGSDRLQTRDRSWRSADSLARREFLAITLEDTPLSGARLRSLVTNQRQKPGIVGFGVGAWKAARRDRFIGWRVRNVKRGCTGGEQRPFLDPALGTGAQTRFRRAGAHRPAAALRLAGSLRVPTRAGRDLCAIRPLCRYLLPRGQLDPSRTDSGPRQIRRVHIWHYPLRHEFRRRLCVPLNPPPNRCHGSRRTAISRLRVSGSVCRIAKW